MYFAYWINVYLDEPTPRMCPITETHARWMFALLSRVEDFVTADEQSTLRNLARACMQLIKERLQDKTDSNPPSPSKEPATIGLTSCWMIITVVIGMWGQRDLWSDAEEMLSSIGKD